MIKAILFDLDGVLIETEKETFKFYQEYFKKNYNIIIKDEDFKYKTGRKSKDFFKDIFTPEQREKIDTKRITDYKRELFNTQIDKYTKKVPGGRELLQYLKEKGYLMALVSQNEPRMIKSTMDWLKIEKYFGVILSLDDISNKKPNPEIYLLAARGLKVKPDECIVIEDAYDGVTAAKNGKFVCIALRHNYMPEETYENADKIADSLKKVGEIITEMNSIDN